MEEQNINDIHNDVEEDIDNEAENVIADYDDYPQYDYDGDYEEAITGPGSPDYGQYYDYDYDSKNPGSSGSDMNEEGSGIVDEEHVYSEEDKSISKEYDYVDTTESPTMKIENENDSDEYESEEDFSEVSPGTTTEMVTSEISNVPDATSTTETQVSSALLHVLRSELHYISKLCHTKSFWNAFVFLEGRK